MKRREYVATILDDTGESVGSVTGYAFNSTIRKSEQWMREHAREVGKAFEGWQPIRVEGVYYRTWVGYQGAPKILHVEVREVPA